ncbi:helix-turn-helix transcriptional regulator [Halospeciosus flavus]|uniref:Helix-turn-helix transcriptional regulator n=1 Tax=Halospeciosus flavus TaxID=3032283 RepID=A0ABD5Z0F3_9EURY|nr:transcriptional regulator FilR1 domain-containing protein [Halospeciosus flavus]
MNDSEALEEIEFLARSANRIEVLTTLADDAYTRRDLGEVVDVSQPTLGRILRDLGERNWIAYDGERYRATATGRLVETGITDLWERLAADVHLRPVAEWLPTGVLDFDLRHLGDATITTPSQTRPNAPIQRMLRLLRGADRALLLSHAFNEQKLDLVRRRAVDGSLTTKGVFAAEAIDALAAEPTLRDDLRDVVAADAAEIRVYDGTVPVAVEVTDGRTHFLLRDAEGIVRASLDTDDETVRAWAAETHQRYWEDAEPLDVDWFEE